MTLFLTGDVLLWIYNQTCLYNTSCRLTGKPGKRRIRNPTMANQDSNRFSCGRNGAEPF